MTDTVTARLLGGPFDGDEGSLILPLPDALWVFACPDGLGRGGCAFDGIHWHRTRTLGAASYRRGPVADGVQIYVHRDLELQSREQRADETPAEDLAHAA